MRDSEKPAAGDAARNSPDSARATHETYEILTVRAPKAAYSPAQAGQSNQRRSKKLSRP